MKVGNRKSVSLNVNLKCKLKDTDYSEYALYSQWMIELYQKMHIFSDIVVVEEKIKSVNF